MLNLSPLFFTTADDQTCLHEELDLTLAQRTAIASARMEIRTCLRTGIPLMLKAVGYTEQVPTPRFLLRKGHGRTRR